MDIRALVVVVVVYIRGCPTTAATAAANSRQVDNHRRSVAARGIAAAVPLKLPLTVFTISAPIGQAAQSL